MITRRKFLPLCAAVLAAFSYLPAQTPKEGLQRSVGTNTIVGSVTGSAVQVATIAALKAQSVATMTNGQIVTVAGYASAGDGAGGLFQYNSASSATDNGGTIIQPTSGSGRWLRVYSGAVEAKWFGALGDGTTDDTAEITAAITAAGASGGVQFTAGKTYIVSSAIDITVDGVVLTGYGATIKTSTATQSTIFDVAGQTGVQFHGLTFDGRYTAGAGVTDRGLIDISGSSSRILIKDCTFQNTRDAAIRVIGATSDCDITGCRFVTYYNGIYTNLNGSSQPTNLRIHNNYFGTPVTGTNSAISMHGTAASPYGGHDIRGNVIEASTTMGIELQTSVNGCTVVGNVIRGTQWGVSLSDSDNMVVTGNNIKNTSEYGIEVAGCENVSIGDNTIEASTDSGIAVIAASARVSVTGGVIIAGSIGIYINSGEATISGVSIRNPTSACIYVHNGSGLTITGNTLSMANTAGSFITFDATDNAISKFNVTGNRFTGTSQNNCISLYTPNGHVISDLLVTNNTTTGATFSAAAWQSGSSINRDTSLLRIRAFNNIGSGGDYATNYQTDLNALYWSNNSDRATYWDYFALDGGTMLIDASGGARTVRLPNSAGLAGYTATFAKSDSSGNAATLTTYGSQTISGNNAAGTYVSATSYALSAQGARVTVLSDGTNWRIIQAR